ncbi:MAG: DNA-directed RNA polymerase subunit omega [Verrucomicrobiae bacterium]|nr:DNA-directed RNA polymerase subunit omega [Verrucomicrobiae bacterium]MDW8310243.1 DNA-directed RNA polymerase subunit omega [Verrucomicrobiales bacterium]
MNAELCRKALERVGNPNLLVNIVSRRVRQLNSGAGAISRPLIPDAQNLGAADIALREIVEGKIGWELPESPDLGGVVPQKKRRKPAWR